MELVEIHVRHTRNKKSKKLKYVAETLSNIIHSFDYI